MNTTTVRTRFAPSPTGWMHIGNLRTALYAYLIARSADGRFVLRIEDTDQERFIDGAIDVIYSTLRQAGLSHDEGPDIGGPYAPYIQSKRLEHYLPLAQKLVSDDQAYYCFCTKDDLMRRRIGTDSLAGYDRHCRDLSKSEVEKRLARGDAHVIRQKIPLEGQTTFHDAVFGTICVDNKDIEDQVLIKSDGFPTYNFANVVDDHLMAITHIVRGSEYLSSTPKHKRLYDAFGWAVPTYVHLPLIQGKNEDGSVSKLSKRHGATHFGGLLDEGYLPQAITNYIALLGWSPKGDTREIYTLNELVDVFRIDGINKSPALFDYEKLRWFNGMYIRAMDKQTFTNHAKPYYEKLGLTDTSLFSLLYETLHPRIERFSDIVDKLSFIQKQPDYSPDLFTHKKSKSTTQSAYAVLRSAYTALASLDSWDHDSLWACLVGIADKMNLKKSIVMWPVRIAVSGTQVTPGGAIEVLILVGKTGALARIDDAIARLKIHMHNQEAQ